MKIICLLLTLSLSLCAYSKVCAYDRTSLNNLFNSAQFPLTWIETTANDGKPLKVKISELNSELSLEFIKTKEGLWARGTATICKETSGIVATISKSQIQLGKAAPWVLRMSMKSGANFKLTYEGPDRLIISTFGWSGDFAPLKPL